MEAISKFIRMITFPELFKGMAVTAKYFFQRKVTEQYPDQKTILPYRTKGKLHVDIDKCISLCRFCEKVCPEGCIKVFPPPKELAKTDKRPVEFYINQEHCLHCGMCVDSCSTGAIHHSDEYELVVIDFKELLGDKETLPYDMIKKHYRWNYLENVPVKIKDSPLKEEEKSQ
ncbi:MAG TPA: 4Fe-4S dicluster domain-containing protein [Acidobacteriota bacterium]|nr:4Fe-4S dicluster domain-containing protein [Acidobacteriota bacterium]HNT16333.1 4Fe-4S dicluster domain-containing protein [Acidobacteriota bacterium]